jgi:D-serine deaminase-like pyridoxal phosphate-dependent protein
MTLSELHDLPILAASAHTADLLTPALVVSASRVDRNIETTLAVLDDDAGRWRPHVKTAKLGWTMARLMHHGITCFKCSTTLELATLAGLGAADVLFAMPLTRASARRIGEVVSAHPGVSVSALADSEIVTGMWPSTVGLMVDVNVGMDRTGIDVDDVDGVARIAQSALDRGIRLAGLHAYDGHLAMLPPRERAAAVHATVTRVVGLVGALQDLGVPVVDVVTSGSLTFRDAACDERLSKCGVRHQVSPGTVVYADTTTIEHIDGLEYRTAVHVVSRVISAPAAGVVTCDAGHKAVSADAGVPTCAVVGWPGLRAQQPSEEHLPLTGGASRPPGVGDLLELVPRHVCPTVNLFDKAILVEPDGSTRLVEIEARGHEANLPPHAAVTTSS